MDLSGNGRYLTFASLADNLAPGDNNQAKDVFLRDLATGETLLVSRTPDGAVGNRWSTQPFFSPDGRCLFFLSHASNLAPDDLNQSVDLFKVEILEAPLLLVIQRNLSGGGARLLWNAKPDRSYRVEFTPNLEAPNWQPLAVKPGPDGSLELEAARPPGFYRLLELP